MPVIGRFTAALEARTLLRHIVRVVEPDEPRAVRCVQREGIGQAVWPLRRCRDAPDFKLEPVALFKMMNTAVECEQKLESLGPTPNDSYHLVT
jgi:hypothetical protein